MRKLTQEEKNEITNLKDEKDKTINSGCLISFVGIILFILGMSIEVYSGEQGLDNAMTGFVFGIVITFSGFFCFFRYARIDKKRKTLDSKIAEITNRPKVEYEKEEEEKNRAYREDELMLRKKYPDLGWAKLDACARMVSAYSITSYKPVVPTYTEGVIKGSLADNISTLSNAQKKADYEAAMAKYNTNKDSAKNNKEEYYRIYKRMISKMSPKDRHTAEMCMYHYGSKLSSWTSLM